MSLSSLQRLLAELKRRKVFRVAAVYAATAFVVLQAADLTLPRLGVPEWALSLIVVLVVLGFPIALVLGWALELTPDGVRVTASQRAEEPAAEVSLLGRRTIVATALLFVLGTGLGAGWFMRPDVSDPLATEFGAVPVMAVLPFENYSPSAADAYFAGGITEEITSQLSRLAGLRVMSRTAVSRALELGGSLADVAGELGIGSVLEGSIRVADGRVRITAQLVDPRSGQHLWSEDYDRDFSDIFEIQRDVALAIVAAMRTRVAPGELERMEKPPTDNLAAYQLYLRAGQLTGNVPTENRLAVELLREAVALDPRFALAWSRLAWRHQWETFHGDETAPAKALEYSGIALELDPLSPDAHSARAAAYVAMERFDEVHQAFRRALELEPNHRAALLDGGMAAALTGAQAEGLRLSAGALQTMPNVPNVRYHVGAPIILMDDDERLTGWLDLAVDEEMDFHRLETLRITLYVQQGRIDRALERLRQAETHHGGHPEFEAFAADVRVFAGQLEDARPVIERNFRDAPETSLWRVTNRTPRFNLAFILARTGDAERAADLLDEALRSQLARIEAGSTASKRRVEIAAIHALRGDADAAIEWLGRAFDAGHRAHRLLRQDPVFEPLRGDARFERLLERMADANARERARVEAAGIAAAVDAMIAAGPQRREAP